MEEEFEVKFVTDPWEIARLEALRLEEDSLKGSGMYIDQDIDGYYLVVEPEIVLSNMRPEISHREFWPENSAS